MNNVLVSTAYFPPIDYFSLLNNSDCVILEGAEYYQKQSYRTRCYINSSNGSIFLNIPIVRVSTGTSKHCIRDIKIDYSDDWVKQHTKALISAYNSSPFFEYYFYDDFIPILLEKKEFLFDLNLSLLNKLQELIGLSLNIEISNSYLLPNELIERYGSNNIIDARGIIHPKKEVLFYKEKPYYQVFTPKHGFIPNQSILDLLFNEGPNSGSYL